MKAWKIAGLVIVVIAIILALPLLLGLPIGVFATAIQDQVERDTGYRMSIAGAVSFNVWPSLHAILTDVTFQDPRDREGSWPRTACPCSHADA